MDILNARRKTSDICWILKNYESKISFFNNYKSKGIIKKSILDSVEFKYDLKLICDKTGKSEQEMQEEADKILSNMSHNIGMNSIRFMGLSLSKIMKRIYTHVNINYEGVKKLREAFEDSNVVLLPTHRSYADFLLVSYMMFCFNLPLPVIAAAMDFMNMKFVGELLRSCGAFFIRRSFADDDLYWSVFSNYVKTLVKISQESLEFFIEGTRSRTNKSLYPKIGMLGILFEMWLSDPRDIKFVPIGISYDRLLEEKLYAWELFGVPKPKESTSGLLKVRHILKESYGNVYFHIGEPMSMSEIANQHGIKKHDHNLQLRFRPSLFEPEKIFVRQLSKIIVESQQKNFVISDWTIIVFILMNHEINEALPLSLLELRQLYLKMVDLLFAFDVKLAALFDTKIISLTEEAAMVRILEALYVHKNLVIHEHGGVILRSWMDRLRLADESQKNSVIVDRIHIGIYRNPILFHVARESILLRRIRFCVPVDLPTIYEDFKNTIELFSREFIFSGTPKHNFDTSVARLREAHLLEDGWTINVNHECLSLMENGITLHVIAYIIYGQMFVTKIMTTSAPMKLANEVKILQKKVIKMCSDHTWLGDRYLEICSLDIARNVLAQLTDINLRQSLVVVKTLLNGLYNLLSADLKIHLQVALDDITEANMNTVSENDV